MWDARRALGAGYQPRLWAKSLRGGAGGGGRPESNIAIQPSGRNLSLHMYCNIALQQYRPRAKIEDRSTAAVIGYARVSTPEQAARGLSLEVQKAKVLAMAMLEDGGPEDVQIREDKQPRRGRGRACSRSCRLSAAGRGSPPYWATPPPLAWLNG